MDAYLLPFGHKCALSDFLLAWRSQKIKAVGLAPIDPEGLLSLVRFLLDMRRRSFSGVMDKEVVSWNGLINEMFLENGMSLRLFHELLCVSQRVFASC